MRQLASARVDTELPFYCLPWVQVIEEEDSSSGRITLGGAAHLQRRPDLASAACAASQSRVECMTSSSASIGRIFSISGKVLLREVSDSQLAAQEA